jgi:hypothetical protein
MQMNQKQHIIPQVYLKQFGYLDKNRTLKVPVLDIEEIPLMEQINKTIIHQSNIESLLREENIYDIPINGTDKRQLEDFFKLTEDNYQQVIDEIKTTRELSSDKMQKLIAFISLLYVRTKDFRLILNHVIDNNDFTYINGILSNNRKRLNAIVELPKNSAINFLTAFSGGYVYNCLQHFRVAIIETIPDKKWATSDNPVMISFKADENKRIDFMGIDTKIFCPLSPDYLAYIDHKDSKYNVYNELLCLEENRTNKISKETFESIMNNITSKSRITKYLIIPNENINN